MKIKIINAKGLHARASAKLAEVCEQYDAEVLITYDEMQVEGASIMGLMMLGAAKGAEIEVAASGAQAEEAKIAIKALIDNYFGEGG